MIDYSTNQVVWTLQSDKNREFRIDLTLFILIAKESKSESEFRLKLWMLGKIHTKKKSLAAKA